MVAFVDHGHIRHALHERGLVRYIVYIELVAHAWDGRF